MRPQLLDTVYFKLHYCPKIKDYGVVLLTSEGLWARWVQKHHVPGMLNLLDSTESIPSGQITLIKEFYWTARGGVCNRGTVKLR